MQVAEPKRDRGRSADTHVAMEHDAIDFRCCFKKLGDGRRVVESEKYVGRILGLYDVTEPQSKHRNKTWRQSRRLGGRIGDRNANLFARRLVTLRILSRQYPDLRRRFP